MNAVDYFRVIRREFSHWQSWEVWYLCICTLAIAVISVKLGDNALGIASAITGTLYTMLAGKGKISCYLFGIFNSAAYGYIAFSQRLYGDAMLNWGWYLPMMFAGITCWKRQLDGNGCVIKNRLTWRKRILTVAVCAAAVAGYGMILYRMGDGQPVTDSVTTVFSVTAMILTVKRCVEQWLMWILVNAVSVFMWLRVYIDGGNSIATLLWWLIMLVTGIIFFIQWTRELKKTAGQQAGS